MGSACTQAFAYLKTKEERRNKGKKEDGDEEKEETKRKVSFLFVPA